MRPPDTVLSQSDRKLRCHLRESATVDHKSPASLFCGRHAQDKKEMVCGRRAPATTKSVICDCGKPEKLVPTFHDVRRTTNPVLGITFLENKLETTTILERIRMQKCLGNPLVDEYWDFPSLGLLCSPNAVFLFIGYLIPTIDNRRIHSLIDY